LNARGQKTNARRGLSVGRTKITLSGGASNLKRLNTVRGGKFYQKFAVACKFN
jgi:hypothetical protein